MISFTVYGNPVAQGRPRAFKMGNRIGMYDPKNSREWKQTVKLMAMQYRPDGLIEGPVHINLDFFLLRPKSLPKKVQDHIKKPDIENLAKAVIDGLEGIFFKNDSQITVAVMSKNYCEGMEQPRVEIWVGQPKEV